jgi:hypothetical protein
METLRSISAIVNGLHEKRGQILELYGPDQSIEQMLDGYHRLEEVSRAAAIPHRASIRLGGAALEPHFVWSCVHLHGSTLVYCGTP